MDDNIVGFKPLVQCKEWRYLVRKYLVVDENAEGCGIPEHKLLIAAALAEWGKPEITDTHIRFTLPKGEVRSYFRSRFDTQPSPELIAIAMLVGEKFTTNATMVMLEYKAMCLYQTITRYC
jgi:hypothetical protein